MKSTKISMSLLLFLLTFSSVSRSNEISIVPQVLISKSDEWGQSAGGGNGKRSQYKIPIQSPRQLT